MDPAKSRDLIRSIGGTLGERANRLWQDPANCGMAAVETPSRSNRLIACTEDHCKGEVEGAMEPADAIDRASFERYSVDALNLCQLSVGRYDFDGKRLPVSRCRKTEVFPRTEFGFDVLESIISDDGLSLFTADRRLGDARTRGDSQGIFALLMQASEVPLHRGNSLARLIKGLKERQ
jgi:hypothetical protein